MKIYKSPYVPLTRTEEDGSVTDALFWIIDGSIVIHPDRWDAFVMAIEQPDVFQHPDVKALLLSPMAERNDP